MFYQSLVTTMNSYAFWYLLDYINSDKWMPAK